MILKKQNDRIAEMKNDYMRKRKPQRKSAEKETERNDIERNDTRVLIPTMGQSLLPVDDRRGAKDTVHLNIQEERMSTKRSQIEQTGSAVEVQK